MLKNKRSLLVILGTVVLAVVAIFTAWKLSQPGPVAPTAPKQAPAQEILWGDYASIPSFSLIPGAPAAPAPAPAPAPPAAAPAPAAPTTTTPTTTTTTPPAGGTTTTTTTTTATTPTTTTTTASTTSPLSPAGAPSCGDTKPGSAPTITSATASTNTVTLRWTKATDPVTHYFVVYGTTSGKDQFGSTNIGNKDTTSYTVKSLSGGKTYYFRIAAVNGCMPGNYSNEISAKPSGGTLTGAAEGFTQVTGTVAVAPTKTTTATATPSAQLPVSGVNTPTVAVGIGGILLLLLGLALVF